MRPILLDTNAYVAFKKGDKNLAEIVQHAEILAISPIVLGELLGGFACGNKETKNRQELHEFLNSSRIRILTIGSDTATFYSQIYHSLRMKGKPIPSNDMWIAAQVLEEGCVLCTYDQHFQYIDGIVNGNHLADLTL